MLTLIAEVGINHNGQFKYIEEMVRQIVTGGADLIKFQLYTSKLLFGDESRKKYEFTIEQITDIKSICDYYEIEFFASVFDDEKLEWCESLGVKRYKLASRMVAKDLSFCQKIINIGKPVIASLGMWDQMHLPFKQSNVAYLNCISKYPTRYSDLKKFVYNDKVVGLSDHSYGITNVLYNIVQGAKIIEKHFTLSKTMEGNDHVTSMDLEELILLNRHGRNLEKTYEMLG